MGLHEPMPWSSNTCIFWAMYFSSNGSVRTFVRIHPDNDVNSPLINLLEVASLASSVRFHLGTIYVANDLDSFVPPPHFCSSRSSLPFNCACIDFIGNWMIREYTLFQCIFCVLILRLILLGIHRLDCNTGEETHRISHNSLVIPHVLNYIFYEEIISLQYCSIV